MWKNKQDMKAHCYYSTCEVDEEVTESQGRAQPHS